MDLRERQNLRSCFNGEEWLFNRKRKNDSNYSEKKKKSFAEEKSHKYQRDTFCWICHKIEVTLKCPSCPRAYHMTCLQKQNFSSIENGCPECHFLSVNGYEEYSSPYNKNLKAALISALKRVFCDKRKHIDLIFKWPINEENKKLIKIVDYEFFLEKLSVGHYKTPVAFFSDFKWLLHNCAITYGDNQKLIQTAEILTNKLREELSSLEACTDCYYDRNCRGESDTQLAQTCSTSHEIVWAKVRGFSYWPAKCLKVTGTGSAFIVFFGTQEIKHVASNKWFYLNHQNKISSPQQKYCNAIQELLAYNERLQSNTQRTKKKGNKKSPTSSTNFEKEAINISPEDKESQTSFTDFEESSNPNDSKPEILMVASGVDFDLEDRPSNVIHPQNQLSSTNNCITGVATNSPVHSVDSAMPHPLLSPSSDSLSVDMTFSAEEDTHSGVNIEEILGNSASQMTQDNAKNKEGSVDQNIANRAKEISEQNPELKKLFHEKTKEFSDAMMVLVYNCLPQPQSASSSTTPTSAPEVQNAGKISHVEKELKYFKEEKEKLDQKVKEMDIWMKIIPLKYQNYIREIIEKHDQNLREYETRLKNIKKERDELLEKQDSSGN